MANQKFLIASGDFHIPDLAIILSQSFTLQQFQNLELYSDCEPIVANGNHGSYRLPRFKTASGRFVNCTIFFKEEILESIIMSVSEDEKLSWDSYSPEDENRRLQFIEEFLKEIGLNEGRYIWGNVWSGKDTKSGDAKIVISYAQMDLWDYWRRTGPDGVTYEVFRSAKSVTNKAERFIQMERLKRDLSWVQDCSGLREEWMQGWFIFDEDGLSCEEVEKLIEKWKTEGNWPGRT